MMKCRWWDSNPHGFPNDFESFASAIPPHRLIFNFGTLVPVSGDWRDVQEGCKKSRSDKPSKPNVHSWISRTDTENHEGDFESFASAIPPHRLIFNFGTLVPVFEDWRDVQEGCKKSHSDKLSKFNAPSWISCADMENHEADFEFSAFLSGCIVTDRMKKLIRILSWQFHFNPPIKEIFRPEIIAKDAAMVITPMPPIWISSKMTNWPKADQYVAVSCIMYTNCWGRSKQCIRERRYQSASAGKRQH